MPVPRSPKSPNRNEISRSSSQLSAASFVGLLVLVGLLLVNLSLHESTPSTSSTDTADTVSQPFWNSEGGSFCARRSLGCEDWKRVQLLEIRNAWKDPTILSAMEEATAVDTKNQWAQVHVSRPQAQPTSYQMLTRDSTKDQFISKLIQSGASFDNHVRQTIFTAIETFEQTMQTEKFPTVMIDCGANIGWFTTNALAYSDRTTVISFEPMRSNAGVLMNTVQQNHWQHRHFLYHNALHWEPVRVSMKPTNADVNLSNGHIVSESCPNIKSTENDGSALKQQYGVDYMDAVTLDQVMFTNHPDILHVAVMKIDVETNEPKVLNGAMGFLCHRIVHTIIVEVAYLKSSVYDPAKKSGGCYPNRMLRTLEQLGYDVHGASGQFSTTAKLTGMDIDDLPANDIVFQLQDTSQTPARRLQQQQAANSRNPCSGVRGNALLKTQHTINEQN